jgi:hypothetical protein
VRAVLAAVLLWGALAASAPTSKAREPVALELVLAVDASSSVDREEFRLQMQGLAAAFRHPDVQTAIGTLGLGGVAVMLLQWSSGDLQLVAVPWTRLTGPRDAEAFAQRLDRTPRRVGAGGTAIGPALTRAARAIHTNGYEGVRKVIDLSGDGRANKGERPSRVRDRLTAAGITINALAILNEEPHLDSYYRDRVVGGRGSFLMRAADYQSFAQAMLHKLIREITGTPVAGRAPESPHGPARLAARRAP